MSIVLQHSAPPAARRRDALASAERTLGLLMLAALAVGAWQGTAALSTPAAARRLSALLDGPALLDGRAAAAVDAVESRALPADGLLRAAGGVVRWRVFGSGGPQVAVGCGDWLFLTEELRPWPHADEAMRERADILARAAAALAARNTELVVALVPDKARVEAGSLCGAPRSAQADARYGAFTHLLLARRVHAVDLAAPMAAARRDGPLFFRTDTHWNGRGAALAVRLIAAAVTMPPGPAARYRTERAEAETDRPGDLLRLMGLDQVPDTTPALRPRPDRERVERTVAVEAPPPAGDLLDGAPNGDVVLLGSSFSLHSDFQGRLEEALGRPVDNVALAGGAFAGAAGRYFAGAAPDAPPRLVVWEIPERAVGLPLDSSDRALYAELFRQR
ncbi:alginate O-acetyltransferase AlgX-related protein [Lichenibacterium dinghuense]|uniref:alginate O-acetyltransferase AlgX-related protein n=1 Tax=Lichenibacterium dinghuense TaxID=2895977 RepID=UPI001F3C24A8|nr:hypothetical protein [Lichenibacterium sp. 6Y81]